MQLLAATLAAATVLTQVEFPSRYFDLVEREPFPVALVAGARRRAAVRARALALAELWRGHEQLADGGGAAPVALDEHRVEPRVLV